MKKVIVIIALMMIGLTAYGQNTVKAIKEGFQKGSFYIGTEKGTKNIMQFDVVEGTETRDFDGNILTAYFVTRTDNEYNSKGNEFLKANCEKADKDDNYKYVIMPLVFNEYGLTIMTYDYTDDGRVKVSFFIN